MSMPPIPQNSDTRTCKKGFKTMDSDPYMYEVTKLNPETEQFEVFIGFVNYKLVRVIVKLK